MSLSKRGAKDVVQAGELAGRAVVADRGDSLCCDACGRVIEGEPAARGLFLWTRGEEVRYEEPPLCSRCAGTPVFGLDDEGLDEG
jgi:hypothetical protein